MRPIDRFESKFAKTEGCWMWLAGCDKDGYGRFRLGQKKVRANRAAYEFYKGEIPLGLVVRHRCDTPGCVNPAHLELGTYLDNSRDCVERGRQARGPGLFANRRSYAGHCHPGARISEQQAIAILSDSRLHREIANDYGVTRAAISHLKRGKTWAHLKYPKLGNV